MHNLRLHSDREGNILPIALIAFAIVAFVFIVDYSISGGKWPWSTNSTTNNKVNTKSFELDQNVNGAIIIQTPSEDTINGNSNTNVGLTNFNLNNNGSRTDLSNTNQNVNTTTNSNRNTNLSVDVGLQVQFIDAQTRQPIVGTTVQLYTDNGVRCVQDPCPTNGRAWLGKTDSNGRIITPTDVVDESMTFTLNGYQGKELHVGGTVQADGSWILPLQFGVTGI